MISSAFSVKPLWEALKETSFPIVLYGTGDGADKIIAALEERAIPLAAIFVSDDFYRGQLFHGQPVTTLSALEAQHEEFIILVAFGSHLPEIEARVKWMAGRHPLYLPDMPVYGETLFDPSFVRAHAAELQAAYDLLADEESRAVFRAAVEYKLSGAPEPLFAMESPKEEVFARLIPLGSAEHYLDLGAYRGDTVQELLSATGGKYASITALEPDPRTFKKLSQFMEPLSAARALPCGVSDRSEMVCMQTGRGRGTSRGGSTPIQMVTVDELAQPFTYIKMDVEGSEAAALRGAASTLRDYRPKLNIACYHRSEDLYQLPLLIHELQPAYKIYLRRHPCIPCWDLNLYCL